MHSIKHVKIIRDIDTSLSNKQIIITKNRMNNKRIERTVYVIERIVWRNFFYVPGSSTDYYY